MAQFDFLESIEDLNEKEKAEFVMRKILFTSQLNRSVAKLDPTLSPKIQKNLEEQQQIMYEKVFEKIIYRKHDTEIKNIIETMEMKYTKITEFFVVSCGDLLDDTSEKYYRKKFTDLEDNIQMPILEAVANVANANTWEIIMKLKKQCYKSNNRPKTKKSSKLPISDIFFFILIIILSLIAAYHR